MRVVSKCEFSVINEWEYLSTNAQNLVSKCLRINPYDRISIDEILESKWLKDILEKDNSNLNNTTIYLNINDSEINQS